MGANVFSRPQTQRDVPRIFSQVKSSQFDSARRWQTLRNSLTRKRSLVQIQYGPPFSKTCPVLGAKRGARGEPEAEGTGLSKQLYEIYLKEQAAEKGTQ